MIPLDQITRAQFETCIGQPFEMLDDASGVTLALVEARALGTARPGAPREPFALKFQGAPGLRLPQRIYRLKNAHLGELEIFIVPIAASPVGTEFEAIFT